uniref:G-protein coupled receptors family 1 profile domain-containing protein n=1 Tax=Denticeps clupeoides TaxID=299321 RepID=A0AAY4AGX9_9TELE
MDSSTNTTDDYYYDSNPINPEELLSAVPCRIEDTWSFTRTFTPVINVLVFVLAVVGNVLVLCVVQRYRLSHHGRCSFSLTDTFLLNLAVSDLLLAFSLPFFAVQSAHGWVFGRGTCKVIGALFSLNIYCGILFLACISFDRYLAIVHAVSSGWKRHTFHAPLACAVIWVTCFGLAIVDVQFREVDRLPNGLLGCKIVFTNNYSVEIQVGLQLMNLVLAFALPLLVMLYCYMRILRSLCHATRRQKRKSLRLIITLVSVFVLCWAPYQCFRLVDSLQMLQVIPKSCSLNRLMDIGTVVTESMGLCHCALNPLLYGFVGVKFRKELGQMFKTMLRPGGCMSLVNYMQTQGSRRRMNGSFSSVESENSSYFSVMV